MTAIVKTWHWQVIDVAEFKKLHRVFEDKQMKKTGASKMCLRRDLTSADDIYYADLYFKKFADLDKFDAYFKTKAGMKFGEAISKTASCFARDYCENVDY